MATVNEKMKAIADAIRAKTGKTDPLTLDGMAAEIASISGGGETPAIGTCELEVYYDGEKYFVFDNSLSRKKKIVPKIMEILNEE